jgi:hypothetical protein
MAFNIRPRAKHRESLLDHGVRGRAEIEGRAEIKLEASHKLLRE